MLYISYVQHAARSKVLCGLIEVFTVEIFYISTTCHSW